MKLLRINASGTVDLTQLASTVAWSGDYKSCARTLAVSLLSSATDSDLPTPSVALGDKLAFYADDQVFSGIIVSITQGSSDKTMAITACDYGLYLNRNSGYYKFSASTPEAIVKKIAADYGLALGNVAATGVPISRNFMGVTLYKIIATAYTLASAETGDKYHIGFELGKLCVRKKTQDASTLIVQGGSNLLTAEVTESIESMINRVVIVGDDYAGVSSLDTTDDIAKYGLMQAVVQDGDDAAATAKQKLADGGVSQKITLECIGDTRSVTGRMVAVHEPHTGLWGLFWIENDKHTWKNGVYTNKLTVSLKCVMDETTAGTELTASATSGAAASASTTTTSESTAAAGSWAYYNR